MSSKNKNEYFDDDDWIDRMIEESIQEEVEKVTYRVGDVIEYMRARNSGNYKKNITSKIKEIKKEGYSQTYYLTERGDMVSLKEINGKVKSCPRRTLKF